MTVVRARAVTKTFGTGRAERTVLRGADLDVAAGELVAVVGRSGSGKSTLLHVLAGLDRPDSGTIEIAGGRVDGVRDAQLTALRARAIGFVFQFFHLVPELTGVENVLLPTRVRPSPDGSLRRAHELLERLDLRDVARSLPHELSGGEQQRFAIARALVNAPSLLLADEPTGNLDAGAAAEVLALLRELADEGRGVVVVTHDDAATTIADRVLHLADGRLVSP